jgi:hypothetical protein
VVFDILIVREDALAERHDQKDLVYNLVRTDELAERHWRRVGIGHNVDTGPNSIREDALAERQWRLRFF